MAVGVAPVAVGVGADEVDGVVNLEVGEGLCEVVEGFGRAADGYEDFAVPAAEGFADGLALGFVIQRLAVVHQRELAEERAALFDSLLEEGRAGGRSNGNPAVDDAAVTPLGEAPGEGFAIHHECTGDLTVVGADVSGLRHQDDPAVVNVRGSNGKAGDCVVRDIEGEGDVVDDGIDPFGEGMGEGVVGSAERQDGGRGGSGFRNRVEYDRLFGCLPGIPVREVPDQAGGCRKHQEGDQPGQPFAPNQAASGLRRGSLLPNHAKFIVSYLFHFDSFI